MTSERQLTRHNRELGRHVGRFGVEKTFYKGLVSVYKAGVFAETIFLVSAEE